MKILYFSWNEILKDICIGEMRKLGHVVTEYVSSISKYDHDKELMSSLKSRIEKESISGKGFDLIFSFNYFPDVSRVSDELTIPYASWVYDSPHLTLRSKTFGNKCNRVFVFDNMLYQKLAAEGFETVRYLPLPARIVHSDQNEKSIYRHDITFLGSLYDGEQDSYGQITTFPDHLKGFLDALIAAEGKVYGFDIIDSIVDETLYLNVNQYVNAKLGEDYRDCGAEIFKDMMRRRTTSNERIEVLKRLGVKHKVDLYSGRKPQNLPVNYMGYADYSFKMPRVFKESKINLNVTLRSIQSGIPLRVMDILGAGGFCLTNYQTEIAEYFENGTDLVWYESMDDLMEKAAYYLSHDEERERIAQNGQKKAAEDFSYKRALEQIFKEV